ncbi:flagellar motor switch protein FliM [Desulfocicer niacini]
MANVLSQDEVDSLLGGIDAGSVATETDVPDNNEEAIAYNFASESGPLNLPTFQVINERLTGFLREKLSLLTNKNIDVKLVSNELIRFNDFCRSLPLPASINVFKIDPLRGAALLVLEGRLVFSFVEIFFGGKGLNPWKLEGRAFTPIESRIIEKICRIILNELQTVWTDVHDVKMIFSHSEIDPQFTQITKPEDMVIATRFSVALPNTSGTLFFCIPYATIEPLKEKFKQKLGYDSLEVDKVWQAALLQKIQSVPLNVSCILGTARINAGELLELSAEDVIMLDQKTVDPVVIKIGDVPKFKGFPGAYNNNKAVRICEKIQKE